MSIFIGLLLALGCAVLFGSALMPSASPEQRTAASATPAPGVA